MYVKRQIGPELFVRFVQRLVYMDISK